MLAWVLALLSSACMPSAPDPQPVTVRVEGEVGPERLAGYQQLGEQAVVEVEQLWGPGALTHPVRLVIAADDAEFARLTGHPPQEQQVPAVTVGSGQRAHVVAHPSTWDRLGAEGRQAVVTHEVTHLMMQGDGPVPAWLGEGLAEYTAHRDSPTPVAVIAGSALQPVRRGELPTGWPDPTGAVTAEKGDRWGGYAMAWLACEFIASDHSEEQLIELYHQVAGGAPLADAMPAVLGVTEQELLDAWGRWLADLPRAEHG